MYVCPNALKVKPIPFLLCSAQMESGIDYRSKDNAYKALCAHQKHCDCALQVINSESAQECYLAFLRKQK